MQIEAVRAFVSICDLGSFQAAADRLHMSQPAISKRMANLEQRLGHPLFDRIGRSVALTEAGRAYLPHARQLLVVLADGRRAIDNLGGEVVGPLRMALSHHVGLHRMPDILRDYARRYPAVTPEIRFVDSEAACRQVANGELELAVITLPTSAHPLLVEDHIWIDPMSVFVARDHALAAVEPLAASALAEHPALLPPPQSYTYAIIITALARLGVTLAPRMTSHYLETLQMLAAAGLGWTVLPSSMTHPQLIRIDIEGMSMHRTLGAIRHPQRSLSNAGRMLLQMLYDARDSTQAPQADKR